MTHGIKWAGQGDLQFYCTDAPMEAKWGYVPAEGDEVYPTDDGYLYTFNRLLVTCVACIVAMREANHRGKQEE